MSWQQNMKIMKLRTETKEKRAQTAGAANRSGIWLEMLALAFMALLAGCQTAPPEPSPSDFALIRGLPNSPMNLGTNAATKPEVLVLQEGDMVRVTFPGANALN